MVVMYISGQGKDGPTQLVWQTNAEINLFSSYLTANGQELMFASLFDDLTFYKLRRYMIQVSQMMDLIGCQP